MIILFICVRELDTGCLLTPIRVQQVRVGPEMNIPPNATDVCMSVYAHGCGIATSLATSHLAKICIS